QAQSARYLPQLGQVPVAEGRARDLRLTEETSAPQHAVPTVEPRLAVAGVGLRAKARIGSECIRHPFPDSADHVKRSAAGRSSREFASATSARAIERPVGGEGRSAVVSPGPTALGAL